MVSESSSHDQMDTGVLQCYDPSYDVVFKELFGSEKNKDMLIALINDAMDWRGEHQILDVTFLNTDISQRTPDEKGIRYDIRAVAKNGEQFIVEMQRKHEADYEKRTVFYASRAYVLQLEEPGKEGRANDKRVKSYSDISAVIVISILDHSLFKSSDRFLNHYSTRDTESQRKLIGSPEYIYVELGKFVSKNEHYLTGDIDHMSGIERWAYILKAATHMQNIPQGLKGTPQGQALSRINRNTLTPEQREAWDKSILDQRAREQKIQGLEDQILQAEEAQSKAEEAQSKAEEAMRQAEKGRIREMQARLQAEDQNQQLLEEVRALKRQLEWPSSVSDPKKGKSDF